MVTMEKIDIKHVLNAIDNRDFSWIDTLTQEEKKKLSIWQIMRFVSSCDAYNNDIKASFFTYVNGGVNKEEIEKEIAENMLCCAKCKTQYIPRDLENDGRDISKVDSDVIDYPEEKHISKTAKSRDAVTFPFCPCCPLERVP